MIRLAFIAALFGACVTDDEPETCAAVGCVSAPSGTETEWTPCTTDACFCRVDDTTTVTCVQEAL